MNLFSYAALSVSTKEEHAFLATLFLFAASIALEGLSIKNDKSDIDHRYDKSAIILWCMRILFTISIASISFAALCLVGYIHCTFEGNNTINMFIYGVGLMAFN